MSSQYSGVAVYPTLTESDQAVNEPQEDGVGTHELSIIGNGCHVDEHALGYYDADDRMKYWGKVGAFWGGFWRMLVESSFLVIPGFGQS